MPYDQRVGSGVVVQFPEPSRSDYPNNVGGAIAYYYHLFVYNVIRLMGRPLSRWFGGIFGDFFKDISGELKDVLGEYYKEIASNEAYPPSLRKIFEKLANPQGEAEAALAMLIGGVAISSVLGPVTQALATPLIYWLNNKLNIHRDGPDTLVPMYFRGNISEATLFDYMNDLGYAEPLRNAYIEANRPRISASDLVTAARRKSITWEYAAVELKKRGYTDDDIGILKTLINTLLDPSDIFRAYYRGFIDRQLAGELLQELGYSPGLSDLLLKLSENIPPLSDITRMAVREAWRDETAQKWGYDEDFPDIVSTYVQKLGYDPDWAKRYWRAHWELPSVTMGIDMVHKGVITPDEFKDLLRIADYPAGWRDRISQVIYEPFTRVDIRRMYGMGILSYDDVVKEYKKLGYDDWHATKLADFTVKYEAHDTETKPEQYRQLTVGLLQKAYLKGLITRDELYNRLLELKYEPDEAKLIADLTDLSKTVEKAPDSFEYYQKDMKALIQRSYSKGMIDYDTAYKALLDINVTEKEAEYLLSIAEYVYTENLHSDEVDLIGKAYVARAISETDAIERLGKLGIPAREQSLLFDQWNLKLHLGTRRLTESQLRNALEAGSISLDDYIEGLQGQEYCEKDIATMVDMTLESMKGSVANRLIKIGKLDQEKYFNTLRRLGYTDDEIRAKLGIKP